MFKHYIKLAARNLQRHKIFSIINIAGLAVALASAFLILLYVLHEFSFDRFHKNADRIFRVVVSLDHSVQGDSASASVSFSLGPKLKQDFPEVKNAARIRRDFWPIMVKQGNEFIREQSFFLADKELFEILTLPFLYGDPDQVLNHPSGVIITKKTAKKYFKVKNPVGRILTIRKNQQQIDLKVTGVLQDFPENSTLSADFIGFFSEELGGPRLEGPPLPKLCNTYLLIHPGIDIPALEKKIAGMKAARDYISKEAKVKLALQPLTDVYLRSAFIRSDLPQGNISNIYLFSIIGFLILLIAGINYVILSTARSASRSLEIGIRKVVGAQKTNLMRQILSESVLVSFLALPFSLVLVELCLPLANSLLEKSMRIDYLHNWHYITGLFGITLVVGLISGCYLAFYLSGFRPVDVLKSRSSSGIQKSYFRKVFIVVQLIIFIALITSTLIIAKQIHFAQNKDIGFEKKNLMLINLPNDQSFLKHYQTFKKAILDYPDVRLVSAANGSPITGIHTKEFIPIPDDPGNIVTFVNLSGDIDYFKVFSFSLKEGRSFSSKFSTDSSAALINETGVSALGLKKPLGSKVKGKSNTWRIIGVVKDFHFSSIHSKIPPTVISLQKRPRMMVVKINDRNTKKTLNFIENQWKKITLQAPFEFSFFDDEYNNLYRHDRQFGSTIYVFTFLAIFIAAMGLFGLSLFIAKQKVKEIGIRKVMGASTRNIIMLISREFIILVIFANIIAWPVAYFTMRKWLENFAYRTNITAWVFMSTAVFSLFIVFSTLVLNALRAAHSDPVTALRYE